MGKRGRNCYHNGGSFIPPPPKLGQEDWRVEGWEENAEREKRNELDKVKRDDA